MGISRAIVLFPRSAELAAIEEFRRRHDPLATVIAAHVTLVFPFVSALEADVLRSHIAATTAAVPPFVIRFDGVTAEDEGYLFFNITRGSATIRQLHDRLYTGPLSPHLSSRHVYTPHLTVGRLPTASEQAAALREAAATLPGFEADVSALVVHRLRAPRGGFTELEVQLAP